MYNREEIIQIENIYQTVKPIMSNHNIPMTPENYTLWYHYVSGSNKQLVQILDRVMTRKGSLTKNILEKLHQQYCQEQNEANLAQIRNDLETLITTLFEYLGSISGKTETLDKNMNSTIKQLTEATSLTSIGAVVTQIVAETKDFGCFIKDLQEELSSVNHELEHLKKSFEEIRTEILIDFLTSLPNRKAFEEKLQKLMEKSEEREESLSLLLIDIDFFKKFNDTYGHLIGDEVLKFVAHRLRDMIRGTDFAARFGGEEFVILLPKTDIQGAKAVAGHLREFFYQTRLKGKGKRNDLGKVTVSIGVASYKRGEKGTSLVERADKALYFAKEHGRNRVATEYDLL